MASPPQQKRCLYEILGLSRDCSPAEIRSAYRKLALQRHPDKLVRTGVSEADATAQFQELANAFEILSDARERAWYDSHRSQILLSNSESPASSSTVIVPELFRYFSSSVFSGYADSGKGFYAVYGAVFDRVHQAEVSFAKKNGFSLPKEAPLFGNLECHYSQVTDFYDHWLGFATVMDEEENGKLRKKACREYNETVRGLTVFVKKRDKRVIDMTREMEKKKEMEKEKKKEMEKLHKFYDKYRQFKI